MTTEEFLTQDTSFNIHHFEQGERVVRVERAPFKQLYCNENLGVTTEVIEHADGSYIGEELEFLGVHNRIICLRRIENPHGLDPILKLHIDQWGDGWQKYSIPEF